MPTKFTEGEVNKNHRNSADAEFGKQQKGLDCSKKISKKKI